MTDTTPDYPERVAIPASLRVTPLAQIARHEIGHNVVARILGFDTGEVSIKLLGLEPRYRATSTIIAVRPLGNVEDILNHLENRIVTLLAGVVAEAHSVDNIGNNDIEYALSYGGGEYDHQIIRELVHVVRNIRHPSESGHELVQKGYDKIYRAMRRRCVDIVSQEYELIAGLALKLSARLQWIGDGVGWLAEDLAALPEIQARFNAKSRMQADCSGATVDA